MKKKRRTTKKATEPLSLHPLTPEKVLKKALGVPARDDKKKPTKEK